MASRWIIVEPAQEAVESLQVSLDLPTVVAAALVNRGIDSPEATETFLDPRLSGLGDPSLMHDMDRAVERTIEALNRNETICIYGDYDADGITSTALLASFFDMISSQVRTFLPDRIRDGYGLNADRLKELVDDGVGLFIAVDCGTKNREEADLVRSMGADLIVLDHHSTGETLPRVAALVNPHRRDCEFPFKDLAAVGVAFYFVGAMRRALVEAGRLERNDVDVRLLLDLVCVGTITDAVPLLEDNRVLVAAGLRLLSEEPRLGLSALKAVAGIRNRPVTSGGVAFQLGPRLNAVGRLGNPAIGLDLLMARDPEEASRFADKLDNENLRRREVEADVLEQAVRQVEDAGGPQHRAVVVSGDGWHPGVVGIVASKLLETYKRPAVVIGVNDGIGRGSCRSVSGFDIGEALSRLSHLLVKSGGHPMAAGLTVEPGRIADFRHSLHELADEEIDDESLVPLVRLDAELPLGTINVGLVESLRGLAPHGIGNPEPVFGAFRVEVEKARKVGRDRRHLQLSFRGDGVSVPAIWWGGGEADGPSRGDIVDVAFTLMLDDRTGRPRMKVREVRANQSLS